MRKGFDGLSVRAQEVLREDPFSGHLFVFRGKRGDLIKVLYWDGQGLCLFAKRLERGRFIWPQAREGSVTLSPAQLAMLLEGIEGAAAHRSSDVCRVTIQYLDLVPSRPFPAASTGCAHTGSIRISRWMW